MAMRFLRARDVGTGYQVQVLLDTARVLADGTTPDPAWVHILEYAKRGDVSGVVVAADGTITSRPSQIVGVNVADLIREAKLACQAELGRRQASAGTPILAVEGTVF